MIYMPGVIFCEQRGMATKIGFLEASGSYGRRLLGLRSTACAPSLNLPAPGRRHTLFDFEFLNAQICNGRKMFNIAGQQGKLMFQRRCGNQRIT